MLFFERINILHILKNHFKTFYDNRNERISKCEIALICITIFGVAFLLCYHQKLLDKDNIDVFLNSFAIVGGFLITSLFVLIERSEQKTSGNSEKLELIKETFYNVSYGVLLCLLIVTMLVFYVLIPVETKVFKDITVNHLMCFFIYSLSFSFLHTILMVIKRLSRIF